VEFLKSAVLRLSSPYLLLHLQEDLKISFVTSVFLCKYRAMCYFIFLYINCNLNTVTNKCIFLKKDHFHSIQSSNSQIQHG
jgi:hypothetical protein